MTDPYSVLGLRPGASMDEVKTAYRRLAKKYHPDLNHGDPECEKKMKDINAAYDAITNPQPEKEAYADPFRSAWGGAYAGNGGYREESEPSELKAALHFIQTGYYQDALNALSGVRESERGARWYYLSAIANFNLGSRITAAEHIGRAVKMEPANLEYRQAMQRIHEGGESYARRGAQYGFRVPNAARAIFCLCLAGSVFSNFLCRSRGYPGFVFCC